MSISVMNRVWWREDIRGMTKFVALALADAADEDGVCYPSVETIAIKCGCQPRTVQNATKALEGMCLLRKIYRNDRSNVYQFVLENMPILERKKGNKEAGFLEIIAGEGDSPAPMNEMHPPMNEMHPGGEGDSPRTHIGTQSEPSLFTGSLALPAVPTEEEKTEEIVEFVTTKWTEAAEKHPGVQRCRLPLDRARRAMIVSRSKQLEEGQSIGEMWTEFFAQIEASAFLQGRARPGKDRDKPFSLAFGWALKAGNFNKIMEGFYGSDSQSADATGANGRRLGPAEQATHRTLSRRRAARERSGQGRNQAVNQ